MTDTSNVRNKLATRNQGTAVEPPPDGAQPLAVVVRQMIDKQSSAFRTVLPKVVDPERFSRLVLNAVKSTPDLMQCFGTQQGQMTVLLSAMKAAMIGLEPNTPLQHAWLLPRRNKGVMECELSIGYRGYLKLARRSGNIATIYAQEVRQHDEFEWWRGLDEDHLKFRPAPDDARGELTNAFAVARFTGGGYSFIVLDRTAVEKRRAMSDSWKNEKSRPYSPWVKWTDEQWRKTAVRALAPYMDLSADVAEALAADEVPLKFDDEAGVIDVGSNFEDGPADEAVQPAIEQAPEPYDERPFQ